MLRDQGRLYLGHKGYTEWPAAAIDAAGPADVRVLWLAGNKITAIPGAQLAKLVNLEKLDVSCNLLETLPIELGRLERLRTLICHRNPFGALPEAGRPRGTEDSNDTLQYMRSPQAAQALAGAVPAAAARTADVPGTPPASESSGGAASLPAATASAAAAGAPRLGVINDHSPASAAFDEGPVPPRAMLREGGSLYMSHRNMSAWPATAINAIGPANVRVLWLAGNKITAIPGAQLAKLVNLEKLDVSCNLLETLPIELGGWSACGR
eukprot:tig00020780_g13767.t1